MKPLYFNECFGWYHGTHGKRAVVICGAIGHEALWTHKGLVLLADSLSRRGYPTLRFDYPDTGDSGDLPADASRVASWVDSIRIACRTARALSGADEIVLVGVRGGALLAAQALDARAGDAGPHADAVDDTGVSAVAWLAPAVRGRMLVRGMHMLDRTWRAMAGTAVSREGAGAAVEGEPAYVLGMRYAATTLEALSACDMTKTDTGTRRVFIAGDAAQVGPLVAHCEATAVGVDSTDFPEELGWLQDPLHGTPPVATFDALADWVAALPPGPTDLRAPAATATQDRIAQDGWTETAVQFSAGLYGVLCEPGTVRGDCPALVISNGGNTHRVGAGRSGVSLARELAGSGIASLRIDVRGIGDSILSETALTGGDVEPEGHHDTMRAVDWLVARGYPRVMGFGVSYGASLSLLACHAHERVVGAIMVNLPRLRMRETFQRPRWMIHGRQAPATGDGVAGPVDIGSVLPKPTATEQREVETMMTGLASRGVALHMLFGEEDPGPHELVRYFGPRWSGLAGMRGLKAGRVHQLDHGMLHPPGRRNVVDYCLAVLTGQTGRLAEVPVDWVVPGETLVGKEQAPDLASESAAL